MSKDRLQSLEKELAERKEKSKAITARWQAEKALSQLRAHLDAYQVQDTDYPIKLLTPMSTYYECYPGAGD